MGRKLQNGPLQSLLNGSGINNIPRLNIISSNSGVTAANDCGRGPIRIGANGTQADCVRVCANSNVNLIMVNPGERYVYESTVLEEGAHCVVGPRPECNMRTTVALMTVNSIVCRPKFPNLIGGQLGTTVVACNNQFVNDPQNYLWDFKFNKRVDPLTTNITDEDERLPNGRFRFRCRFRGVDDRGNRYMTHPYDRLQPMINYCASSIYQAHPAVKTIIDRQFGRFRCYCGDFKETRVRHLIPDNNTSVCSHLSQLVRVETKKRKILELPYKCFTLFSTLDEVGKYLPCSTDQFTRKGSQMSSVTVPFSESEELIEHPNYKDFERGGKVRVYEGIDV